MCAKALSDRMSEWVRKGGGRALWGVGVGGCQWMASICATYTHTHLYSGEGQPWATHRSTAPSSCDTCTWAVCSTTLGEMMPRCAAARDDRVDGDICGIGVVLESGFLGLLAMGLGLGMGILTINTQSGGWTDDHLTGEAVHAAAAEGLRLIALLQIVDEQLAGGQQVEFAIWWKGNARKSYEYISPRWTVARTQLKNQPSIHIKEKG